MSSFYDSRVLARVKAHGEANADPYRNAFPFPHIVIEDFLPPKVIEPVLAAFPNPRAGVEWIEFNNEEERKLAFPRAEKMPGILRDVLYFLNAQPMLEFLEKLTGIQNLIPDPYFIGGGLHQIEPGGKLGVHVDFNKYERFDLDRRLNLLLYMNKDWQESYGGHLELWDRTMTRCESRVLPLFNRCVVFSTTESSFHGHPVPLTCPEGRTRKSIATYYYTNGRPEAEQGNSHSTVFRRRPGEEADRIELARKVIRSFVPPVVTDAVRFLKRRIGPNGA